MAKTKVEISELQHRTEAVQTSKEAGAEAAAAREKALMAEVEQLRARADAMSQSLAEVGLTFRTAFVLVHFNLYHTCYVDHCCRLQEEAQIPIPAVSSTHMTLFGWVRMKWSPLMRSIAT